MKKQLLILICGHNASGKSTISKEILSKMKDLNSVNGDVIREMLIENIKYYSDMHYSYPNEKIQSANKLVTLLRKELIQELLSKGESVLIDGAGITKEKRQIYIDLQKHAPHKVITVIIEAVLDEKILIDRLQARDKENKKHRWLDFYHDIRKEKYEVVEDEEANYVFVYDQTNLDYIIEGILKLTKKI